MSDQDNHQSNEDAAKNAADGSRVKFQGIVETEATPSLHADPSDDAIAAIPVDRPRRNWNHASRQVWQVTRLGAILIFSALALGWPLGAYLSHRDVYGTTTGWFGTYQGMMTPSILMFTVFVPVLVLLCGYLLSHAYKMLNAAESIASAAGQFIHPDKSAAYNAEAVGIAVRGQMAALNTGVDDSLQRLASVEAMIRNHVEAIESAGDTIEHRAAGAVDRVASERSRLIELTENLNTQADAFANAIAKRAQVSIEAMGSADDLSTKAESLLEERLSRLETAAARALQSFEALSVALHSAEGDLETSTTSIEASAEKAKSASEAASKASQQAAENISQDAKAISDTAIETTTNEVEKISAAASKVIGDIGEKSNAAIKAAADDARKATTTASEISQTAEKTKQAASKASSEIAKASATVEKSAGEALALTEKTTATMENRNSALAKARAALEVENQRLEKLIEEQRSRANRLADAITTQTERLSKLAEAQLHEQAAAEKLASTPPIAQPTGSPKPSSDSEDSTSTSQVLNLNAEMRRSNPAAKTSARDQRQSSPQQTERLDQLAKDIAANRPEKKSAQDQRSTGKKNTQPLKDKKDASWREILDATDDADPLDLAAASKTIEPAAAPASTQSDTANAIKIIGELQSFTYSLETRLYGDPPPALRDRFERSDRNVFANRIVRLNEADVKRRIRMESGRDRAFEAGIHEFLQGFERLLEDATTSQTADEDLEEYLSSPLGRVYLLIGATVGYFA